ncbi:hypothetical protein HSBAA_00700 [Vreelandella sulfidaeris]|uniref:16S rRNA (uracil(1498)-N(3))-methyltransferase n=1 Tax=Vreelandella sulfidaeris TaxID=115553 RepID=A0A455U5F9_9GAMM|nr:hypothetical protein HSBAA_00700 [Halomonas sulfidaeris]
MSETMQAPPAADWYAQHGKMPRLYVPADFVAGGELALPEGPARHVTRVLRMGKARRWCYLTAKVLRQGCAWWTLAASRR